MQLIWVYIDYRYALFLSLKELKSTTKKLPRNDTEKPEWKVRIAMEKKKESEVLGGGLIQIYIHLNIPTNIDTSCNSSITKSRTDSMQLYLIFQNIGSIYIFQF